MLGAPNRIRSAPSCGVAVEVADVILGLMAAEIETRFALCLVCLHASNPLLFLHGLSLGATCPAERGPIQNDAPCRSC